MRKIFPNTPSGRAAAESEPPVDGKKEVSVTTTVITVVTGDDVITVDFRPTVTKWQFVQACVDAGITEAQLDTAVATLTAKRQRFWRLTTVIDRDNQISSGIRTALTPVPSPAAWNTIFLAAAALDPLIV